MRTYLSVFLLLVTLLSACKGSKPKQESPAADNEFREAYAQAASLEKEATSRLMHLDRLDRKQETSQETSEEEAQLLESDRHLNQAIEGLYARSWSKEAGSGSDSALRAALLHWTTLVRRAFMQGLHTRVHGLENDPDCAGDLVGDGMLLRYFEAVLAHRETDAALALTDLARQSACLGVSQSDQLANVLAGTFEELRAFLRLQGHEDLVPFVVQAGSNPLLLFYDVEKYRGLDTPLARWFRDHRDILSEGADFGRNPARWHGLWLYDRRSGRLIGYRETLKPADENDVNLGQFFQSIVEPENLGDYGCSFAEMVERGAGSLGYFCGGSTCRQETRPASGGVSAGRSPWRRSDRAVDTTVGGMTNLDVIYGRAVCDAGADGRDPSGATPKCGSEDRYGGNRAADAVRCLSEQVVRPGTEGFHCLAESGGRCADPGGKLIKDLQLTSFAGIKVGPKCTLSVGMGDVKQAEWEAEKLRKEREARQKEIDRLKEVIQKMDDAMAEDKALQEGFDDDAARAFDSYKEAKKAAEETGRDPNTDPDVQEAYQRAQEAARKAAEAREATNSTRRTAAALQAKALEDLKKKEKEDAEKRKEEDKKKQQAGKDGGNKRCDRDNPNCDSCTGMSQAARDTLGCIEAALSEAQQDPLGGHGGCDPLRCDPIEPDPGASGSRACFEVIANDPVAATSKFCWAVQCAQGQTPATGPNGCSCRVGGGSLQPTQTGGVQNFCAQMHCSEGSPVYQNGRCSCGGEGTTVGGAIGTNRGGLGGPPVPKRFSPVLGAPPSFSEVRYGPRP